MRLRVDSRGEKALERLPCLVDHSERGVPGACQLGRRIDEPLQKSVQRELGAERDARFDEDAKAVEFGPLCHTAWCR